MFCKFCGEKLDAPGAVCRFCGQQDAALEGGIGFFDLLTTRKEKATGEPECVSILPKSPDGYYDEKQYNGGRAKEKWTGLTTRLTVALLAAMSAALVLVIIIAAVKVSSVKKKYEALQAENETYIAENTELQEKLQQYEADQFIDADGKLGGSEARDGDEETGEQQSSDAEIQSEDEGSEAEESEAAVSDVELFISQPKSRGINPGTKMADGVSYELFKLEFAGINCSAVWQKLDENGVWQQLGTGFESTCEKKENSTVFTLEYSEKDAAGEAYTGTYRCIILEQSNAVHISNEAEITVGAEETTEPQVNFPKISGEDSEDTEIPADSGESTAPEATDSGESTDLEDADTGRTGAGATAEETTKK